MYLPGCFKNSNGKGNGIGNIGFRGLGYHEKLRNGHNNGNQNETKTKEKIPKKADLHNSNKMKKKHPRSRQLKPERTALRTDSVSLTPPHTNRKPTSFVPGRNTKSGKTIHGKTGKTYPICTNETLGSDAPVVNNNHPAKQLIHSQNKYFDEEEIELGSGIFYALKTDCDSAESETVVSITSSLLSDCASSEQEGKNQGIAECNNINNYQEFGFLLEKYLDDYRKATNLCSVDVSISPDNDNIDEAQGLSRPGSTEIYKNMNENVGASSNCEIVDMSGGVRKMRRRAPAATHTYDCWGNKRDDYDEWCINRLRQIRSTYTGDLSLYELEDSNQDEILTPSINSRISLAFERRDPRVMLSFVAPQNAFFDPRLPIAMDLLGPNFMHKELGENSRQLMKGDLKKHRTKVMSIQVSQVIGSVMGSYVIPRYKQLGVGESFWFRQNVYRCDSKPVWIQVRITRLPSRDLLAESQDITSLEWMKDIVSLPMLDQIQLTPC
mmetsp:Transcript_1085/g.1272  ORF Transcript_1085/g.1272 Transcript_1085/m.1272 type:complete len:495 (-) Transcript_1085:279-1763(-)